MVKHIKIFIGIFFLWVLCGAVPQAGAEPVLDAKVSALALQTGESVILTVKIAWPTAEGDYKFIVPQFTSRNLKLIRQGESQESFKQNSELWQAKSFIYELTPLESGEAEIEGFSVQAVLPETAALSFLDVPNFLIRVRKPFLQSGLFFGIAGGAAGLILLVTVLLLLGRRKNRMLAAKIASITEEEKKIESLKLILDEESKKAEAVLSDAVSELKQYLAYRYKIELARMSDQAIIDALKAQDAEYRDIVFIQDILDKAHKVKFAGEELSLRDAKSIGNKMITFIESKKVVGPEI